MVQWDDAPASARCGGLHKTGINPKAQALLDRGRHSLQQIFMGPDRQSGPRRKSLSFHNGTYTVVSDGKVEILCLVNIDPDKFSPPDADFVRRKNSVICVYLVHFYTRGLRRIHGQALCTSRRIVVMKRGLSSDFRIIDEFFTNLWKE